MMISPEWTSRRLRSCSLDEFDPGSPLVLVDVDRDVFFFFFIFIIIFFFVLRKKMIRVFPVGVIVQMRVVKSLHVRVIRGSSQRDRYESILGEFGDAMSGVRGCWRHDDAPKEQVGRQTMCGRNFKK